jgi:glycosyltransferase involved in cell wall biosynthesis
MRACSVLVMPFLVTPLIEGVDPVKIYEYIATGRPVVASDYKELEHFGPLIARYRNARQFTQLVAESLIQVASKQGETRNFIETNCWKARALEIEGALNDV